MGEKMREFINLGKKKVVIGLIHLKPMPGTPFFEEGDFEKSLEKAQYDAKALYDGGADGCLVQTVERVYPLGDEADYARVAGMAAITHAVSQSTGPDFQIGVQIMVNALKASVAIAKVCDGSYIRCAALVGSTMTPWGLVQANPHDFLTYRANIGAKNIKLIVEIDGMHFKWFGDKKPIAEIARAAQRLGADAVEIANPDPEVTLQTIEQIKQTLPDLPVILGGYTNHSNAARLLSAADGAFVGTCFENGDWGGRIDPQRVEEYVKIVQGLKALS
jgi:uncharacterized protein